MSFLPYSWARPFLFSMDAEVAHEHTLAMLAKTQNTPLQCLYAQKRVGDPITLAGLTFPNRVGLAAGLDKNAQCIDAFNAMGFGFVEVGTVTPKGQPGNPKPRMFRLPKAQGLINRLGFNNEGLDVFLHNVQKAHFREKAHKHQMLLGLNIGKNASTPIENAADDYLICLEGVYPHADYITVNISWPNTKGLRDLQSEAALNRLLARLRQEASALQQQHRRRVPLFLKVAPDLDAAGLESVAQAVIRHEIEAVIATNTTLDRGAVQGHPHAGEPGGLSGAPVLARSNAALEQLRALLPPEVALIGVGGILGAQDGVQKCALGADLVQVYSGLIYRGPQLVSDLVAALSDCQRA